MYSNYPNSAPFIVTTNPTVFIPYPANTCPSTVVRFVESSAPFWYEKIRENQFLETCPSVCNYQQSVPLIKPMYFWYTK